MQQFLRLANRYICDIPVYEPGRPIEELARELGIAPATILKLASNENALGPSPRAVAAMRKALRNAHRYPDGGAFCLRQALGKKLRVSPDNLIIGNGSNELIELLYHAFIAPGDEVVAGDRAFAVYAICAKLFQARLVEVPFAGHTHDLNAMREAVTAKTKLVFIANPNNPTGTRVGNRQLGAFIRSLPAHVICVLDEAYVEFLDDPPPSIEWAMRANVVVLRTFSKIAGLAALRIGYAVAQKQCIELLQRVRQPFNVNAIAQAAAQAALGDAAHARRTRAMTRQGLAYLYRQFRRLGLPYVPSCANFVLVNVGDGDRIFEALQRRGVIVRPMRGYRMPEWVRVTVGLPEQNRRFIAALQRQREAT